MPEIERPIRKVHQVRAHVADRAAAPVDPAAPVERVIDGVILDIRRGTEKQIPREPLGLRITAGHRVGETRFETRTVPAEPALRRRPWLRPRDALRPVPER